MPLKSGGALDNEKLRGRASQGLISIGKLGEAQIYSVFSVTSYTTTSGTPIDDVPSLSFTLKQDSQVLVIYNNSSSEEFISDENDNGKFTLIQIDGVDKTESRSEQSKDLISESNGVTSLWVGELSKGDHTVKGRFASNTPPTTVEVKYRQLIVLAFPTTGRGIISGVTSTIQASTTSGSLTDDPQAVHSFTLPSNMECIILNNASSRHGSTEHAYGKFGLINIDGVDKTDSRADQSPFDPNTANSFTSIHSETLTEGSHTIQGRFASNLAGNTVGIDQRQLILIAVPSNFPVFKKKSTVRVTTTSYLTLVDDTEASLSFTLSEDSEVLLIYNASSKEGSTERDDGKFGAIEIDGVYKPESRGEQSMDLSNRANSFTCFWAGTLLAGNHIVKGKFASNESGQTVGIDQRELIVLTIPKKYIL